MPGIAVSLGTPDHSVLALGHSQTPPLSGAGGLCISDLTGDLSRADPVGPHGGRRWRLRGGRKGPALQMGE